MNSSHPMNAAVPISIILIGFRMRKQLLNTLATLSVDYQRGVSSSDYEVLVIENESDDMLSAKEVSTYGPNFHYIPRAETSKTPVYAINEGFSKARGKYIGLMIDGARMLSPRAINYALELFRISENALVTIPGYHLGDQEQHLLDPGTIYQQEKEQLDKINWREDGYKLFEISTFSGANRHGYLQPIMECNCLFASKNNFSLINYADEQFTLPGGGSINLHMYRKIGMLPNTELFVLPGEGSFHQFHGGVTTSTYKDRDQEIQKHRVQLHSLWPDGFHSLRRDPTLYGAVTPPALKFLEQSINYAEKRYHRLNKLGLSLWPDDKALN